jgi:hypothetical protein
LRALTCELRGCASRTKVAPGTNAPQTRWKKRFRPAFKWIHFDTVPKIKPYVPSSAHEILRFLVGRSVLSPSQHGAKTCCADIHYLAESTQSSAWLAAAGIGRGPNMCWLDARKYTATPDGGVGVEYVDSE